MRVPLNDIELENVNEIQVTVLPSGDPVTAQLSPQNDSVLFVAKISPLSSKSFQVSGNCSSNCAVIPLRFNGAWDIKNDYGTTVTFDTQNNGLPSTINGMQAHHHYGVYNTEQGGPYVLIETAPAELLPKHSLMFTNTYVGPIVQEVVAKFNLNFHTKNQIPILVATTRVYSAADTERAGLVELEHSIPAKIMNNTELIMRINTGLKTGHSLWTDESGLEMHERVYDSSLPISGNYHVSFIDYHTIKY